MARRRVNETCRGVTLAQPAIAYAMGALIALCLIGTVAIDAAIGLRDALGIACAVPATGLPARAG